MKFISLLFLAAASLCFGQTALTDGISEAFTAGAGGVTASTLVQLDSSNPSKIVSTTTGVYGIAKATAASTATVQVYRIGTVKCITDTGGATSGDLVIIGTGATNRCKDSGQTLSSGISMETPIVGVFRQNAVAGGGALVELTPGRYGTLVDQINGGTMPVSGTVLGSDSNGKPITSTIGAAPTKPTFISTGTTTCDLSLSSVCEVDFTGTNTATTLAFTNAHISTPQYLLRSCMSATGGGNYSAFPGSSVGFVQPVKAANSCTEQAFSYDGTTYRAGSPSVVGVSGIGGIIPPAAFSTYPACSANYAGYMGVVNDSTTTTQGATVTGSGSNTIAMFCNGTNWIVTSGTGTGSGDSITSPNSTLNVGGSPTNTTLDANTAVIPRKFFGTSAPGSVSGNLPGDTYNDTTGHKAYVCNMPSGTPAPACTAVGAGNWLEQDGSGSGGIVSVVTQAGAPSSACTAPSGSNLALSWDTTNLRLYYCNNTTGPVWRQILDDGAGSGKTPYLSFTGVTSGSAGFTVDDTAGTAILYILPSTNGAAGQYLEDSGSVSCPTLASGAPSNCHQLVWVNPVSVLISTSGPVSDPGGNSVYLFNNASGALKFNLPAGVAGLQRCYRNATGKTGVITIAVTTSNAIDLNGANGTTTTGTLVSGGALGDSVCLASDATNHWYAYAQRGTWTNN